MRKDTAHRSVLAIIVAGLAMMIGGCASTPARTGGVGYDLPPTEPVVFSDEHSRDMIRHTRRLLALQDRDYLVGPDDVLEISIFEWEMREETKTLLFRVSESGVISLPALGAVSVRGQSIQDVQRTIERALEELNVLQNPRVGVSVKEFRSRRIAVIGEVNSPGVYAIHENVSTLLDMLTLAGGPTRNAGQTAHVLRKGGGGQSPLRILVDLQELLSGGNFDLNAVLEGGDVIFVPQAPLVYVYGSVRAPGGYTLNRSMRVLEVIALAGGVSGQADKKRAVIVRRLQDGHEQAFPVNIRAIEKGTDPNLFLRENDVLHVPDSPGLMAGRELWNVFRGIFTFTYRLDGR